MSEFTAKPVILSEADRWLADALDAAPVPACVVDAAGETVASNQAFRDAGPLVADLFKQACRSGRPAHNGGTQPPAPHAQREFERLPFRDRFGRAAELLLLRSEEGGSATAHIARRHELLSELTNGGYFDFSRGHPPMLSARLIELFELRRESDHTHLRQLWKRLRHKDRRQMRKHLTAITPEAPDFTLDLRTRAHRIIEIRAVGEFDRDRTLCRLVGTVEDVTGERQSAREQRREAETDYLTGLANRRAAQEQIKRFVQSADSEPFALAFIDLDKFKQINDTHGHAAGDELLRTLATRLTEHTAEHDVVARLGGDEFMLLFHAADRETTRNRLSTLQAAIARTVILDAHSAVEPSVSIGATWISGSNTTESAILREADTAMYASKEQRNNHLTIFEPRMLEVRLEHQRLAQALREGIRRREFELWYQPIVATLNPGFLGFEALMRWHDADHGVVAADAFVPVLEEHRLITELTAILLDRLAGDAERWHESGFLPDSIAFNLSPLQLASDTLPAVCEAFLDRIDPLPVHIVFEVTESAVIENLDQARRILTRLRNRGTRIALDDFGVGYSSLAVLHQLPVEILKLDGEFTRQMFSSDRALKIVQAILDLASSLKIPSVAEGVETHDQANWLTDYGCTYLQGYLFSEALSAADALAHLIEHADRTRLRRAS